MITVDALAKYRFEKEYEESLGVVLELLPAPLRNYVPELSHFTKHDMANHVTVEYA